MTAKAGSPVRAEYLASRPASNIRKAINNREANNSRDARNIGNSSNGIEFNSRREISDSRD